MTGLGDLVTAPSDTLPATSPFRRARVISVSGRNIVVDIGGGMSIPCADSCYPVPNQTVLIAVDGNTWLAIASIGGLNKQSTLTVTSSTSTTVTGLINGGSTVVTKIGGFTVANGDTIPLLWSANGYQVWAGAPEGAPTAAAPTTGGGASSGGGAVQSGTATYAASLAAGYNAANGKWVTGRIPAANGAFFYGASRFRELQGRSITAFRANLGIQSGSPTIGVYGHPHAGIPAGAPTRGFSAGAFNATGWISLPIALANYLIGGSGTGGLTFTGSGILRPLPYGTLQFDWRK